jgi:hypothetical protein
MVSHRELSTCSSPSSFDDVVDWVAAHVGRRLNVLLSSRDGAVLALLSGRLRDLEELQPGRVAFGVGGDDGYVVLDRETFEGVEAVGMASLLIATAPVRVCLEVEGQTV